MNPFLLFALIALMPVDTSAQDGDVSYSRTRAPEDYNHHKRVARELKHNTYTDEWTYEEPEKELKLNPYEDEFQFAFPDDELDYNPYEERWEFR